jgi:hypothetical protein
VWRFCIPLRRNGFHFVAILAIWVTIFAETVTIT